MIKALCAAALLAVLMGCSGGGEPAPSKDDFSKRPPPEGWRGPGNGTPPSGPPSGTQ